MKRNAFTLIELLAIIVILALIMIIAIPTVSKTIENRRRDSFFVAAKAIVKNIEYGDLSYENFIPKSLSEIGIAGVSPKNYNLEDSYVYVQDGLLKINLVGKGKFEDLYACGVFKGSLRVGMIDNSPCSDSTIYANYIPSEGVNRPKLATGMTAVKWNSETNTWVEVASPSTDTTWYDYQNKEWANAVTDDCTNPSDFSTCSMWVWVPRYIYKISSGWHASTAGTINIQFTKDVNDNWNSAAIGDIDTGKSSEASNNKWTNHPAFSFDIIELTGIWVAKFEATASEGLANTAVGDNVITKTVKVVPNVQSWRYITAGNAFTVSRNMETSDTYGWGLTGIGIDTHLMKNIEWGAAAYLSQSVYGKNGDEVWINPNTSFTTGCAGDNATASLSSICNTYDSTNGVEASTTGNIYGVYDMSGGAGDYVAAYMNNGNSYLSTYSSQMVSADPKYSDSYTAVTTGESMAGDYALSVDKKGDAVWEVSGNVMGQYSWTSDSTYIAWASFPIFFRGYNEFAGSSANGIFCLYDGFGSAEDNISFRPVLLVGSGL